MTSAANVAFHEITPAVGAITSALDLRRPLDAATVRAIREAVLKHGVVFFRDQDITREETVAFMKNFGQLSTDPFSVASLTPPSEDKTVHDMPTYRNSRATAVWHMDSTLAPEPAGTATVLPSTTGWARVPPKRSPDATCLTSMV